MDESYDRIVNCPLCGGTLRCFHCTWASEFNWSKYYTNRQHQGEGYSYRPVDCPLCDGTGTALARLIDATVPCTTCHSTGSVETTVQLEVGARKETSRCSTCGGSGKRIQQRIEVKTHKPARETCYFYFDDQQHSISAPGSNVTIDLQGPAKAFFAKWQPASQSPYLREKYEKEKQEAEKKARERTEQAKQQELRQYRIKEGLCVTCGKALGFLDKMSGRQTHKQCA